MSDIPHLRPIPGVRREPAAPADPHMSGGAGGGGNDLGERLARLENQVGHLVTKEEIQKIHVEIQKMKVWILSGVIGGMLAASFIVLATIRMLNA